MAIASDDAAPTSTAALEQKAAVVQIDSLAKQGRRRLERQIDPLLRYTDPARGAAEGVLWAWGGPGRPEAIIEMEVIPKRPEASRWLYGVVSLSAGLIAASWDDGRSWEATEPGLVPQPMPDAPAPAASKAERLRQMKALVRRFRVREVSGAIEGKIQLRPLPTPIHRYEERASGLHDGAIFVFAFGTNPEVLLVIEARAEGASPPAWHYGFARVTGAAVVADLDERAVWTQPEANPPHRGPAYMNRMHPALDLPRAGR